MKVTVPLFRHLLDTPGPKVPEGVLATMAVYGVGVVSLLSSLAMTTASVAPPDDLSVALCSMASEPTP